MRVAPSDKLCPVRRCICDVFRSVSLPAFAQERLRSLKTQIKLPGSSAWAGGEALCWFYSVLVFDGVLEQQSSSISIPTAQAGAVLRAWQFGSLNGIYKWDMEQMKDSFHLK